MPISLMAGAGLIAAVASSWSPVAQARQPEAAAGEQKVQLPIGRRCVITLDPRDPGKRREGAANADSYLVLDNKVEGDLVSVNPEWIVLKDGNYENWVPRDKVLYLRASR